MLRLLHQIPFDGSNQSICLGCISTAQCLSHGNETITCLFNTPVTIISNVFLCLLNGSRVCLNVFEQISKFGILSCLFAKKFCYQILKLFIFVDNSFSWWQQQKNNLLSCLICHLFCLKFHIQHQCLCIRSVCCLGSFCFCCCLWRRIRTVCTCNSIYTHKVPSFLCLWHAAFYVLYFTYRQIKENSLVYSKNYRYKSVTKTKHR